MSTPTVTEIRPPRVALEPYAECVEEREFRRPRRPPYDRAAARRLVRASLDAELHTHAYDSESTR